MFRQVATGVTGISAQVTRPEPRSERDQANKSTNRHGPDDEDEDDFGDADVPQDDVGDPDAPHMSSVTRPFVVVYSGDVSPRCVSRPGRPASRRRSSLGNDAFLLVRTRLCRSRSGRRSVTSG